MRYSLLLLLFAVLCMSLVSCSEEASLQTTAPETLEDAAKARGGADRPFRGTWETTFTPPGDPVTGCDGDPTTGVFIIEGIGNATHMGRCIAVSESEGDDTTQCGYSTIVAANGDLLEFEFAGTVDGSGFPIITFTGDFWFTGGTGRFENATGGGTYFGSGNVLAGTGEVTNIGTVTY